MNNIKKILVPFDFSGSSQSSLNYVKELLKKSKDAEVMLLHVCSAKESDDDIEKKKIKMTEEVRQLSNDLPFCTFQIKVGDLIETILQVQRESNMDLIVMGTEGETEGSNETRTSELVLQADCPVLVIPESVKEFSLKNIALALGEQVIDNSGGLFALHDLARTFDANVHVLTVNRNGVNPVVKPENQEVLEYYLESLLYFHAFPENTDIELGISDYIKQNDVDMLAILPRNHAKSTKPSEGKLTKVLTMHATVPLLTID